MVGGWVGGCVWGRVGGGWVCVECVGGGCRPRGADATELTHRDAFSQRLKLVLREVASHQAQLRVQLALGGARATAVGGLGGQDGVGRGGGGKGGGEGGRQGGARGEGWHAGVLARTSTAPPPPPLHTRTPQPASHAGAAC